MRRDDDDHRRQGNDENVSEQIMKERRAMFAKEKVFCFSLHSETRFFSSLLKIL